jgi:hypothetical protein
MIGIKGMTTLRIHKEKTYMFRSAYCSSLSYRKEISVFFVLVLRNVRMSAKPYAHVFWVVLCVEGVHKEIEKFEVFKKVVLSPLKI